MADHNELIDWLTASPSPKDNQAADLLSQQAERIAELESAHAIAIEIGAQYAAERDQLRAEVETLKVSLRMGAAAEVARAHEVVGLRAEVERLRSDADRYRWLADCNNFYEAICLMANPKLTAHALGEAIDHARTTHKDEG